MPATLIVKLKRLLKTKPLFLLVFPVFFVFHGYVYHYDSVPGSDALLLMVKYIVASLAFTGACWFLYHDLTKASLMAFVIMAFHFFFGNMFDLLNEYLPAGILRYRYVLPFLLLLFLALFIMLKKSKKALSKITSYLNLLLIILIPIDACLLFIKIPAVRENKTFLPATEGFKICDTCTKPDIYLIIPDQYAGSTALKTIFEFDNSTFETELKNRGFYFAGKSKSNYNLTPFSVASTLNMHFLSLKKGKPDYSSVQYSYEVIRNSRVLKFLKASGYSFYNYSIFDFDGQPAQKYSAFLPYGIHLVTAQTFTTRITDDFRQDILDGKFGLKKLQRKLAYENLEFNDRVIDFTSGISAEKTTDPKFVYTHLMMPHYPYYFNSKGYPLPLEKLKSNNRENTKDYIEYLQYTNKRLLELTDNILTGSPSPPIIIILSDHGFQQPEKKDIDPAYDFINLNAVFFPNRNYKKFYDTITNVNQFRVIFNSYFYQQLPMLKDSTAELRK